MHCQQYRLPGGAKMEDRIMKKLGMLGIIGGAAILTAVPLSLQWSQKNVTLSLASAEAQERPLTATSVQVSAEGRIAAHTEVSEQHCRLDVVDFGASRVVF